MDIAVKDMVEKILEIHLITLNDLRHGYVRFRIKERSVKNRDKENSKSLILENGVLKIWEDDKVTKHIKQGNDYIPKVTLDLPPILQQPQEQIAKSVGEEEPGKRIALHL